MPRPFRGPLFAPKLAGASLHDRLLACVGAGLGILAAAVAGTGVESFLPALPFLIAPIGASAVLVFVVPASPLAQPWPVIGGNVISASIGVAVVHLIANPIIAVGTGVAVAILIMSLLRCLHPPGGAAVLTSILGGDAVVQAGWMYPLSIVAVNSVALVVIGFLFHRFSSHSYPHRAASIPPQTRRTTLLRADIDRALSELHETYDITPEDLEALLIRAEKFADQRRLLGK